MLHVSRPQFEKDRPHITHLMGYRECGDEQGHMSPPMMRRKKADGFKYIVMGTARWNMPLLSGKSFQRLEVKNPYAQVVQV